MGTLTISFTGICAFVNDGVGNMFVLLPEHTQPRTVHGSTLPGHFPYVKVQPTAGVTRGPNLPPFVKIIDPPNPEAWLEILTPPMRLDVQPTAAVDDPFQYRDTKDVIHMSKVIAGYDVDDSLIDGGFDPDERRIAVRLDFSRGTLTPAPPAADADVLEFKPRYGKTYRGRFSQKMVWTLASGIYNINSTEVGVPGSKTRWVADTTANDVQIEIGNAPLEDAIFPRRDISLFHEPVDLHFHLYYDLCRDMPSTHPLPTRVSGIKPLKRVGGVNCPPALFQ